MAPSQHSQRVQQWHIDEQAEVPSFGAWLRQQRHALDLTQAELAQQVGCAHKGKRREVTLLAAQATPRFFLPLRLPFML